MFVFKEIMVNSLEDLTGGDFGYDINDLIPGTSGIWRSISSELLSNSFVREFESKLDLDLVFTSHQMDEELVREFADKIDKHTWNHIALSYENLSSKFLIDFRRKMDPTVLVEFQKLPTNLIKHWLEKEKIDIEGVLENQEITIKLINMLLEHPNFKHIIDWAYISKNKKVSDKFFKKFKSELFMNIYCKYQEITQEFMTEFEHDLDWYEISEHQLLTPEFIIQMSQHINSEKLKANTKVNQHELEERGVYVMLSLLNS